MSWKAKVLGLKGSWWAPLAACSPAGSAASARGAPCRQSARTRCRTPRLSDLSAAHAAILRPRIRSAASSPRASARVATEARSCGERGLDAGPRLAQALLRLGLGGGQDLLLAGHRLAAHAGALGAAGPAGLGQLGLHLVEAGGRLGLQPAGVLLVTLDPGDPLGPDLQVGAPQEAASGSTCRGGTGRTARTSCRRRPGAAAPWLRARSPARASETWTLRFSMRIGPAFAYQIAGRASSRAVGPAGWPFEPSGTRAPPGISHQARF